MTNHSEITLTEDQTAVALRTISDAQLGLATLAEFLKKDHRLEHELARNILYLGESHIAQLGTLLGVETDSAKDKEERYGELRAANLRIRALESQLGKEQSPETVQMAIRQLTQTVYAWWRHEGFGHISEIHFGEYGCTVRFSLSLFGNFRLTDSPTPISDKERRRAWHDALAARGFVIAMEDRDAVLVDCDASRTALMDFFAQRLPSAKVRALVNRYREPTGFELVDAEVYIRNLADIANLPVPVVEAEA